MFLFANVTINTGLTAIGIIIWNALTSKNLTGEPIVLSEYKNENFVLGMNYFFFPYFFLFQLSEFSLILMFMWISYKANHRKTGTGASTRETDTQEKEKQKPKKSSGSDK